MKEHRARRFSAEKVRSGVRKAGSEVNATVLHPATFGIMGAALMAHFAGMLSNENLSDWKSITMEVGTVAAVFALGWDTRRREARQKELLEIQQSIVRDRDHELAALRKEFRDLDPGYEQRQADALQEEHINDLLKDWNVPIVVIPISTDNDTPPQV